MTGPAHAIIMRYTNWRGETAIRAIEPREVYLGSTEWHPKTQWLMPAWDLGKGAERVFALAECDFTAGGSTPKPIWETLLKYYTEPEALRWLTEPHPQLDDQAAAVLLAQGNPDPVWRILERLEADGYL
ncbi:MAG: hypothetical protein AAGI34_09580 [Pseudomonadota bacterium]